MSEVLARGQQWLRGWRASLSAPTGQDPTVVLDVCHPGVVLRTVLLVHGVLALGMRFNGGPWRLWLIDVSVMVVAVLPATLAWLVLVCAGQRWLQRLSVVWQWALPIGLGALCGAGVWWAMHWLDGLDLHVSGPLLSSEVTGAVFAALVLYWLHQRAKMHLPTGTQARLTELQSRIRPHFLFNALNSAIALVRVDPAQAETVLEDLAELFRAALVGSGEQVTLAQEIELAQRYLAIEQVRFGERLRVTWDLDSRAGRAKVPSLCLQPLVENAVKHGVEPSPDGGEIEILTVCRQGQVYISITNTVSAGRLRKGHGMALRNVQERLELMHDLAMRFKAGPIEGGRFRVRMALPMPASSSLTKSTRPRRMSRSTRPEGVEPAEVASAKTDRQPDPSMRLRPRRRPAPQE